MQRDLLRLVDLIAAAEAVLRAVDQVPYETFAEDEELRDAVLWRFTKLGEAASQPDAAVKDVPRMLAGARAVLAAEFPAYG